VTELTAVAAERNTTILDVAGRSESLDVLGRALRPTLSHLDTTGLGRELDGQDVLAVRVANQVDDGHVGGDLLLLGNEEDTETILAESLFDGGKTELFPGSAGVGTEANTESVEVLLLGGIDESSPGGLRVHLRDASPVDHATSLAVDSAVALLVAELAGAIEGTLEAHVGAINLVVTDLIAVEALAGDTAAAPGLVGAVTGEVAGLLADTAGTVSNVAAAAAALVAVSRAWRPSQVVIYLKSCRHHHRRPMSRQHQHQLE
jgi:hypothetical protein